MKKKEHIARYGEEAYAKMLAQDRAWQKAHPEEIAALCREQSNKGGKRYKKRLIYDHTGLRGERMKLRYKHGNLWRPYKNIIAPLSQIHHEWIPGTAEYTGVALVEADQHMHGFIDVIEILKGTITLLSEEEIIRGGLGC